MSINTELFADHYPEIAERSDADSYARLLERVGPTQNDLVWGETAETRTIETNGQVMCTSLHIKGKVNLVHTSDNPQSDKPENIIIACTGTVFFHHDSELLTDSNLSHHAKSAEGRIILTSSRGKNSEDAPDIEGTGTRGATGANGGNGAPGSKARWNHRPNPGAAGGSGNGGTRGGDAEHGPNGAYGTNSSHFSIFVQSFSPTATVEMNAVGGNGGAGGDGQIGGPGGKGGNGGSGGRGGQGGYGHSSHHGGNGGRGGNGGPGGNGGNGGNGGDGGDGGNCKVYVLVGGQLPAGWTFNQAGGEGGLPGQGGSGGIGRRGGQGGAGGLGGDGRHLNGPGTGGPGGANGHNGTNGQPGRFGFPGDDGINGKLGIDSIGFTDTTGFNVSLIGHGLAEAACEVLALGDNITYLGDQELA